MTVAPAEAPSPEQDRAARAVVARYEAELTTAGKVGTAEGAHVLQLAAEWARGGHTAAGSAALSRELRAAWEQVMRDAPRAPDVVDELSRRRRERASGE